MSRRRGAAIALVSLAIGTITGCGMSEERYARELDEAVCAWKADCFDESVSEDECVADAEASYSASSCDYDSKAAGDCVRGVRRLDCPEDGELVWPDACGEIWDC